MAEKSSKNWVETLLSFFQEQIPRPFRRSFTLALAVLVVCFTAIKAYFGFDVSDVLSSSHFLTVLTVVLAAFAVDVVRRSRKLWPSVCFSVLLLAAAGSGLLAWKSWQYFYNPVGFYQQRGWKIDLRTQD